jgi:hypothetical protein
MDLVFGVNMYLLHKVICAFLFISGARRRVLTAFPPRHQQEISSWKDTVHGETYFIFLFVLGFCCVLCWIILAVMHCLGC